MGEKKRSYGQHCTVARALDVVGERWTLLLVRELSTGPKRFKDLLGGLPGIGIRRASVEAVTSGTLESRPQV